MTYYEELGISADATEEQIRQAHRRLVKLLHPDQQQDPEVRRVAERQMTRVNLMVEQLLDPSLRLGYDVSLRTSASMSSHVMANAWKFAALGVCVVCILAMLSVSSPTDAVRSAGGGVVSAAPPPPPGPAVPASVPNGRQSGRKAAEAERSSPEYGSLSTTPEVRETAPAVSQAEGKSQGSNAPPQSEVPSQRTNAERAEPAPSLRGVWLYAGGKPSERDKGLYRPEYIEMRISEEGGSVKGDYRSRYAVTNLAISPSVNFTFEGKADVGSILNWRGAKGAMGTLTIQLLNRNAIQVDWKVTDAGESGMGLEFGTATLVRRL